MGDKTVVAYFNKETGKGEVKDHTRKTITGEIIRNPADSKKK